MSIRIELHTGSRSELRALFEEAEDSAEQLDSYLDAGQVLVAVAGDQVVGHLQLVDGPDPQQLASAQRVSTLAVATAAADVGNLRFYQRAGFRLRSIERDAFTPANRLPAPDAHRRHRAARPGLARPRHQSGSTRVTRTLRRDPALS